MLAPFGGNVRTWQPNTWSVAGQVFHPTGTATVPEISVAPAPGQTTVNVQEWSNTAGSVVSWVDTNGTFHGDGSGLTNLPASAATNGFWRFATSTTMADPGAGK